MSLTYPPYFPSSIQTYQPQLLGATSSPTATYTLIGLLTNTLTFSVMGWYQYV